MFALLLRIDLDRTGFAGLFPFFLEHFLVDEARLIGVVVFFEGGRSSLLIAGSVACSTGERRRKFFGGGIAIVCKCRVPPD